MCRLTPVHNHSTELRRVLRKEYLSFMVLGQSEMGMLADHFEHSKS